MAKRKRKEKRGPKPENLQIDEENWENAVKKALFKKRPAEGWGKKGKKTSKSD